MNCAAQDRINCRGAAPKRVKPRKELDAVEKTAHHKRGSAKGCQRGVKNPKLKALEPKSQKGMPKHMLCRNVWQKTKRLIRIHEVCLKCRNAYQESPKHLNEKNRVRQSGSQGNLIERKKARSGKELPERNMMRYFQLKEEAEFRDSIKEFKVSSAVKQLRK